MVNIRDRVKLDFYIFLLAFVIVMLLGAAYQFPSNSASQLLSDYTVASSTPTIFKSWTVQGSTSYSLTCELIWQQSSITGALALSLTTPASPANVNIMAQIYTAVGGVNTFGPITSSGGSFTGGLAAVISTSYIARMTGTVETGVAGGTLSVLAATNATGTATLSRGSFCSLAPK